MTRFPLKFLVPTADTRVTDEVGSARRTERGGGTGAASEHLRRPSESCFTISRTGGTVIVAVHGEIVSEDWLRVDAVLWDLIDAQGNLDVVLDLCDASDLKRDVVPLIVHAARQAHRHGGHLRLADRACRDRLSSSGGWHEM